jgi:hypothetical protein
MVSHRKQRNGLRFVNTLIRLRPRGTEGDLTRNSAPSGIVRMTLPVWASPVRRCLLHVGNPGHEIVPAAIGDVESSYLGLSGKASTAQPNQRGRA